jgi:hypothetical protein
MTTCPHCGASNSSGGIFCVACKKNVRYRGVPPIIAQEASRPLTEEESALVERKGRAEALLWICVSVIVLAVLVVAGLVLSLPDIPESGFAEMRIMFGCITFGPLILIPIIGIVIAAKSMGAAEGGLRELQKSDRTTT